jgi:magnesium transporter
MTSAGHELERPSSAVLRALVDGFVERHPIDAARAIEQLDAPDAARVLAERPAALSCEVLRRMNPDEAAHVLGNLDPEALRDLLMGLDPARAAGLMARLDPETRRRASAALPERTARELDELLRYPPGTAGHLMDARVTTFSADTSVATALARIRTLTARRIADVMLVDEDGRLAGAVALQELVGAAPDQPLGEIARRTVVAVTPMTRREEVVDLLNQHRLTSLPVIDLEGRLIGILRHAELVDAAQQDATADLQQMVGVSREERALSSPWLAVRTRLPWLNVNLVTAFAASAVVGLFEDTIARFTALAVLLPVVAGQSGNTGAQAMAVTMRGLALREIRASHWLRVLRKEFAVGVTNGISIALVTGIGVYIWSQNAALAGIIALAMVLSMCVASLAGATVPVALVAVGRDPATASSIILTTITDVVGFFTFLGLASAFASVLAGG